MRWREVSPPDINAIEAKTIVFETDMRLIASPGSLPGATWIGHSTKVVELDWWNEYRFNEQVKITFTPNQHWSSGEF